MKSIAESAGLVAESRPVQRGSDGGAPVRKVLIIEDNEDNRIIYTAVLEHFGFAVVEADNGYSGIELARKERPDLVLMDLSMPVLDGLEATQALKHDRETSSIPVIVISAHSQPQDRALADRAGCDAFLAKPVGPMDLVEEVSRVLRAAPLVR